MGQCGDVVLLIYSDQSRASAFIQEKELKRALERMDAGTCRLVPVPLDGAKLDESDELEKRLKKVMTATWNARLC